LTSATETKTVAREKKLPVETRGLLAKFAAYLEREGYYKETSYFSLIAALANDGANLLDPEDVKTKMAQHTYKDRKGVTHPWKESVKTLASYAFDLFYAMEGIKWVRPKYKQQDTILDVPLEKDLDALINASHSKRMVAFLQCLKETYADPGEILALEWRDIKDNILQIAHPCKGHLTGEYEISGHLIQLLNKLPKTEARVFPTTYKSMYHCLDGLKKKAARNQCNPVLLDIDFKSFRHWGGSMIAHYSNGNVLTVKKILRHKSIDSTMKYIHEITGLRDDDFEETVAITVEEIRRLGKEGWIKYDEITINGAQMHFYRRLKRFGGLH
jgi:integrase